MAPYAVDIIHLPQPVVLRQILRNVGRPAEIACRRNLHHRVPIERRIIVRCLGGARRRHRSEVQMLAGLRAHLRRIYQPIAAHPHLIVRDWKVGDDVAALVVSDHYLGVFGGQLGRLSDDPHAGLRPAARGFDNAGDVIIIDRNLRGGLRARRIRRRPRQPDNAHHGYSRKQNSPYSHLILPVMPDP
jgi:hypothetical protein